MSILRPFRLSALSFFYFILAIVTAQTGYIYTLDTEYSGQDFFGGWNFFTVGSFCYFVTLAKPFLSKGIQLAGSSRKCL